MRISSTWKSNLALKKPGFPDDSPWVSLGTSAPRLISSCLMAALRMKMMKTEGPSAFFSGAIPRCVQVRCCHMLPLAGRALRVLGQDFNGRPRRSVCLFHDVQDVVYIVSLSKIEHPKSTMLVYIHIFFTMNRYGSLWVHSIFWTTPIHCKQRLCSPSYHIFSVACHARSARWV